MLKMPKSVYDQLRSHAEAAYPDECCGVLLGLVAGRVAGVGADSEKPVMQAIPVENASRGDTRRHYEISPLALIRIEKTARAGGMGIAGFYHSHPDHAAHWSETDLAEAHWLGCSYVITEVCVGTDATSRAGETRSFHLVGSTEEDKRFEAEEIRLAEA